MAVRVTGPLSVAPPGVVDGALQALENLAGSELGLQALCEAGGERVLQVWQRAWLWRDRADSDTYELPARLCCPWLEDTALLYIRI